MPALKLNYFNLTGRAEAIRTAFKLGKVEFEDFRFTGEEWGAKYKALSPTGMSPTIEVDGQVYVESIAIYLYACKLAGLYASDPMKLLQCMQIIMYCEEIWRSLKPWYRDSTSDRDAAASEVFECCRTAAETLDKLCSQKGHEGPADMADVYVHGMLLYFDEILKACKSTKNALRNHEHIQASSEKVAKQLEEL